jgi:hypothetical protein
MDIGSIRQGIAAAAVAVPGLNAYAYALDSVAVPAFLVADIEVGYDKTFGRGIDEITITCRVLVSRADDMDGQAELDTYLAGSGALSVKEALEADRTFAGACESSRVVRAYQYGQYEIGGTFFYGASIEVFVIGQGA